MKRLALLGLLAAATTLLAGCPIFDDSQPGCYDNCGTGGSPTTSQPGTCGAQKDCTGINETCGADGFCHTGDCTLWGCVGGQTCSVVDQKATCGDASGHGGTGGATAMGGASMGGAVSAGGTGGATAMGGTGGATATGGTGGATATGGAGGATSMGGTGGIAPAGGTGGI